MWQTGECTAERILAPIGCFTRTTEWGRWWLRDDEMRVLCRRPQFPAASQPPPRNSIDSSTPSKSVSVKADLSAQARGGDTA